MCLPDLLKNFFLPKIYFRSPKIT